MTRPPWGVRLERVGAAIVVSPAGVLDGERADRLRQVLLSREDGFERAVVDLRELVGIGPGAVDLLHELRAREQTIAFVAGPTARAALTQAGVCDLELHDDLDALT